LNVTRNNKVPSPNFRQQATPDPDQDIQSEIDSPPHEPGTDEGESSELTSPQPVQLRTVDDRKPQIPVTDDTAIKSQNSREMFTQVQTDFIEMLDSKKDFIISLVQQGIVRYAAFDKYGFFDYVGMRGTKDEAFLINVCQSRGLKLDSIITLARVYIREKFENYLLYQGRDVQLQAVAEYLANVFLNRLYQSSVQDK
jgi:hypothetical protein